MTRILLNGQPILWPLKLFNPATDNEKDVILLNKPTKWHITLLNILLDKRPLEKYVIDFSKEVEDRPTKEILNSK